MRLLPILLFALTPLLHAEVENTAPLEAWLERQASIETLQADFTQERRLPALKEPVSTPGSLTLVSDGSLRWTLGQPPKTVAISDGETVRLIDIAEQEARELSADSARAKPFTLLGDKALNGGLEGFREIFELVEVRMSRGIYQLTTRPRKGAMRRRVPWVFFDIDPEKRELRALEVELEDDTRIRTVFRNTRFNEEIPASRFEFDLSGYEIR